MDTPAFIEFKLDQTKQLLYGRWLRDITFEEYKAGLHQTYKLIQQHNIRLWLQNSEKLSPRSLPEVKWVSEEFGLMLMQSDVKYLAIVTPRSSAHFPDLQAMREKAYRIFGKTKSMEVFETEEEALAWLIPNLQYYKLPSETLQLPNSEVD